MAFEVKNGALAHLEDAPKTPAPKPVKQTETKEEGGE